MLQCYEARQGDYSISTDPDKLDVNKIHDYLANESYWAAGRPLDTVRRCIACSRNYGVYIRGEQAGYGRAITDAATVAWICDVFILAGHRGRGIGKWLMATILADPQLSGVRRWILATRDAHGLYRRFGFQPLEAVDRWMTRVATPSLD